MTNINLFDNYIKTPLNYTGNKSRLLEQIIPLFPKKINRFIDMCCGGASIGLNVINQSQEVVCIDINRPLIELLQTLQLFSENSIISKAEEIIYSFNLSDTFNKGYSVYKPYVEGNNGFKKYNKNGYEKLRTFFNSSQLETGEKSIYLLVLLSFCFNNDIRFNSSGKFNMPVGKTDFNASIREKLHSFKQGIKNKNIKFYFSDFSVVKEFELSENDFVYCDPPYLISNAVYNNSNCQHSAWTEYQEERLLDTLDFLSQKGIRFALSNILSKEGANNTILQKWIEKNNFSVVDIEYHYRSSSYHKINRKSNEREVVILNYDN